MLEFNTTGLCNPNKHYMVDIRKRLEEKKDMIDVGKFFCINRPRQFRKTTIIIATLSKYLAEDYFVLKLDYQGIGEAGFLTQEKFSKTFARMLLDQHEFKNVAIPDKLYDEEQ